jgi:hypothetical protein
MPGTGGEPGAGGTAGVGGAGGDGSTSTCEAFCQIDCIGFLGIFSGHELQHCVALCEEIFPHLADECGREADALIDCVAGVDCEAVEAEAYCQAEAMDWVECNGIDEAWSEIELHSNEHHEHARELLQRAAELVCAEHEPR